MGFAVRNGIPPAELCVKIMMRLRFWLHLGTPEKIWGVGKMNQNNTTGLLVVGLLFGAAVGVAAGFLLAPQAGNKTREILRQGIATGAV